MAETKYNAEGVPQYPNVCGYCCGIKLERPTAFFGALIKSCLCETYAYAL